MTSFDKIMDNNVDGLKTFPLVSKEQVWNKYRKNSGSLFQFVDGELTEVFRKKQLMESDCYIVVANNNGKANISVFGSQEVEGTVIKTEEEEKMEQKEIEEEFERMNTLLSEPDGITLRADRKAFLFKDGPIKTWFYEDRKHNWINSKGQQFEGQETLEIVMEMRLAFFKINLWKMKNPDCTATVFGDVQLLDNGNLFAPMG